jgi:hypothetical protein
VGDETGPSSVGDLGSDRACLASADMLPARLGPGNDASFIKPRWCELRTRNPRTRAS